MTSAFRILLHHSESADPTLIRWIRETIDHIFGVGAGTIVIVLGLTISRVSYRSFLAGFARSQINPAARLRQSNLSG